MNTYIKRLQAKASRNGIKLSMAQVREAYKAIVSDVENPQELELQTVMDNLQNNYESTGLTIAKPEQTTLEETVTTVKTTEPTTQSKDLVQATVTNIAPTQKEIIELVEAEFGKESSDTKDKILSTLKGQVFNNARELQTTISTLKNVESQMILQILKDYQQQASKNSDSLREALDNIAAKNRKESEAFLEQFDTDMKEMMSFFNISTL